MSTEPTCSASTSFKKQNGKLVLMPDRRLTWSSAGAPSPSLQIEGPQIRNLFASKAGSGKIVLRVCVASAQDGTEQNLNFTFINASTALSDREHFKNGLSDVLAHNRATGQSSEPSQAGTPAAAAAAGGGPQLSEKAKGKQRASSTALRSETPQEGGSHDMSLRMALLQREPELRQLHAELVITGAISEDEFWAGREHLLDQASQEQGQQRGRNAQMAEAQQKYGESGEIKISLTPQLIADIFAQHPVVQRAYAENVPPLSETEFWQRFFGSKLWNQIRASSRQAGDSIKDDAVFDKYLGMEEEEQLPKNLDSHEIYRLLDLAATQEDHGETGNEQDYTMQAGRQKGSLPLMRRFNQHSERMLEQSLGDEMHAGHPGFVGSGDPSQRSYESDIVLDDLQESRKQKPVTLDVQDQQKYFEGRESAEGHAFTPEQAQAAVQGVKKHLGQWEPDLGEFKPNETATAQAMSSILSSLHSRAQAKSTKNVSFPPDLLKQMTSLVTTTNEFLRQFWFAVLPPQAGDISYAARMPPEQKAAKAQKMISYLAKTNERVAALAKQGTAYNIKEDRVTGALSATLNAVGHASAYYNSRTRQT